MNVKIWSNPKVMEQHKKGGERNPQNYRKFLWIKEALRKYSKPGATILDLGSGTGVLGTYLEDEYPLIFYDLSKAGLELTKERFGSVRCVRGDALSLPFSDASLDTIVSSDLFEHVTNFDIVIKDCMRILKPGGVLITSLPVWWGCEWIYGTPFFRIFGKRIEKLRNEWLNAFRGGLDEHVHKNPWWVWEKHFKDAGFRTLKKRSVGIHFGDLMNYPIFPRWSIPLLSMFNPIFWGIEKIAGNRLYFLGSLILFVFKKD